jgi:hypothetical protein
MEEEMLLRVFKEDGLQAEAREAVLIFLPFTYLPLKEEIETLDRMLVALNFSRGLRRFVYHEGQPDPELLAGSQARMLFFSEDPEVRPAVISDKNSGSSWVLLPPLALIHKNQDLKKQVWSLLKG